jgi:hypothetical protein
MSTRSIISSKTTASKQDTEEDLATLIYRESQLRKAEAAAAAKSRKTKNSSSTNFNSEKICTSTTNPRSIISSKREKPPKSPSPKEDQPFEKVSRKQYRKTCIKEGCTNFVIKGGVCITHGAQVKRCSSEGCTNQVQKGGVCV